MRSIDGCFGRGPIRVRLERDVRNSGDAGGSSCRTFAQGAAPVEGTRGRTSLQRGRERVIPELIPSCDTLAEADKDAMLLDRTKPAGCEPAQAARASHRPAFLGQDRVRHLDPHDGRTRGCHLGDQRGSVGCQSQLTPSRTNPHDPTLDSTNRIIKACVVCADVFRRPPTRVAPGRLAESKPSLMRVTSGRRRNARRDDGCGSWRMGRGATIALAKVNTDTHIILHHTHTASFGPVGGGEANGFFREGCRCTTCCE